MPRNDPSDIRPPIQYKPRRAARPLSYAEIKAAADRAEARSRLTDHQSDDAFDLRDPRVGGLVINPVPRPP
jgi:hypothetical protein